MTEEKGVTVVSVVESAPVSADALQRQVNAIQEAMKRVMKDGVHYGKIPGCGPKPALLKAGAEKICMMFRLLPSLEIQRQDLANGHREYTVITTLKDPNGVLIGQGVGCCSTMESKYRYRKGEPEPTGRDVPKAYWEARKKDPKAAQVLLGGPEFMTKKVGAAYFIFKASDSKVENTDIADTYNTVLKMAKKRSHVDATITCTAASDIFTQDIDENVDSWDAAESTPAQPATQPVGEKPKSYQPSKLPNDGVPRPYVYRATRVRMLSFDAQHAKNVWKDMKDCAHAVVVGELIYCSMAIPGLEDALVDDRSEEVDPNKKAVQDAMGDDSPSWSDAEIVAQQQKE